MRINSPAISRTRFFSRALRVCQPVAAQAIELALLGAVARQQFEVLDRQEQPIAAGVMNLQAVVRRARRLDRRQADEAPDAVIDVDDEVAGGERGGFREHVLGAALALLLADEAVAENILLADDGEIVRLEAVLHRDDRERQRAGARAFGLRVGGDQLLRFHPVLGEHMAQALARAVAPAGDDDAKAVVAQSADVPDRRVEHVDVFVQTLGGEIASDPAAAIDHVRGARRGLERRQTRERRARQPLTKFLFAQVEPIRLQRPIIGTHGIVLVGRQARAVVVGDLLETLVRGVLDARVEDERRARGVIEETCPSTRRAAAANVRGRSRAAPR